MKVRRSTAEDAAAIAAIDVASWRAAYAGIMPDAYLAALDVDAKADAWAGGLSREDARGRRTIVCERPDGEIVGYATVGADLEDPGMGLLYLMYVSPACWGEGVGRTLMQGASEALAELGYDRAVLWVLEANARARRFYEAAGWRADGREQYNDYGEARLKAVRYAIGL